MNLAALGENIVIKGVDENAYRRLKARAAEEGLNIGEAASLAFAAWSLQGSRQRLRDVARMKVGVKITDDNRLKLKKVKDWSGVEAIRVWRERRKI